MMATHCILAAALAVFFIVCKCRGDIMDNIAGYWPFDESSGDVAHEASGQGLNGSLVNFSGGQGNWVGGKIGGSLHFGGLAARQYVRVPDFAKPTTSLTLSAWVWADSMPQWATIAANWNGLYGALNYGLFGSNPNLSLYFAEPSSQGINVANGSEVRVPDISLGEWHHVSVVANGSTRRVQFWRDGQDAGSFLYSGSFLSATVPHLNIGGEPTYGNPNQGYWDGKIDDLALWTRALSDQEVASIYNAGLSGQPLIPIVPEPSTLAYAAIGGLVLIAERFRRSRRRSSPHSDY